MVFKNMEMNKVTQGESEAEWGLHSFPRAGVTKYHKLGALKQEKFILS